MISKKIEKLLNQQIDLEADSSSFYLAMASWAERSGYNGVSAFLYRHSDEERLHMLKLIKFVNERGGAALIPALKSPPINFKGVSEVFELLLKHEVKVSNEINKLVEHCLADKDYTTHNFLQWYVAEQIEEERLARNLLDKIKLIGSDKGGMYLFDRDLETMQPHADQGV
ncbi:MAG: ferritin [Bacteroidetes bacterium]|jgi:ferritin|nr:ferritin [Bacteroidota bacterium]MBK9320979.1 ferritin [Bacteroidota bacterium]MBK9399634.1 ferritin [Bacteroidota bacterium]